MADTQVEATPLPESIQKGLSASVKHLVNNFLEEKHYSAISEALACRWDKFQSLTAAMKLMEQHGVYLDPAEQERVSGLTEMQMIECLVAKMPSQSKEQFQHFFLQLQLIVSTATRVRTGLEQGRADAVTQAMDDADSTGIAQYILKMAIVQAGSEVTNLKRQHVAFVRDAEGKMSRLVKASEDAQVARERLIKAQGELACFQTAANDNIKKVLMNIAGGGTMAHLHSCLSGWHLYVKKNKHENAIFEEYRELIEAAENRLISAKAEQLKSVRGMIEKRNKGTQESFLGEIFSLWKDDILEARQKAESADAVAAMEAKLSACADQASANAKKVLARCGAASEQGMRDMCWHEWKNFHQEYLKNKDEEDAVKHEAQRIAEFMKKNSQNAQGLLSTMAQQTDSGIVQSALLAWIEYYKEEKQINEYAEVMNAANGKMGAFGDRNKKGAQSVMERQHQHGLIMLYLKVWGAWLLDTRVEKLLKTHKGRIDGKRQQLVGVQQMFRNFAKQLEANIQSGADSQRDLSMGPPPSKKKSGSKADANGALPDINERPGSAVGER